MTDLHSHTRFSDGVLTPTELVGRAVDRGLSRLAITDHDTCAGLPEARTAADGTGLDIVAGIELSVWHTKELHLLGYFVDPESAVLHRSIQGLKTGRIERAREIAARLERIGMPIDIDSLVESAGSGNVGRPHIAKAMVAEGHVGHTDEAFRRFLGSGKPAYVPASRLTAEDGIEAVHRAGGVAVLAHPGIDGAEPVVEVLKNQGLDGLEICHPGHKASSQRRLRRLARRLNLVPTGGSDFHMSGRFDLGDCGVDDAGFEALAALATSSEEPSIGPT